MVETHWYHTLLNILTIGAYENIRTLRQINETKQQLDEFYTQHPDLRRTYHNETINTPIATRPLVIPPPRCIIM